MERVQTPTMPPEKPLVIREDVMPSSGDTAIPTVRRPVGRPRKIVIVEPIKTLVTPSKKVRVFGKVDKPMQKVSNRGDDDQEPVQWWVEGWQRR